MQKKEIEEFILKITKSEEFHNVSYLAFNIRCTILEYVARKKNSQPDSFMRPLLEYITNVFEKQDISRKNMLKYLIDNDKSTWVNHLVITRFKRKPNIAELEYMDAVLSNGEIIPKVDWEDGIFFMIISTYILTYYNKWSCDLRKVVETEKIIYDTNSSGLTEIIGAEFKRDGFIYDGKYYLYNLNTNTNVVDFADEMPAFARIFKEKLNNTDILFRLDERLAVDADHPISYSTINFEKYRGPQFKFKESNFKELKPIIVHINENTMDKLLLVVKRRIDDFGKEFWHVEIETLPYIDENNRNNDFVITTFIHGIYYVESDKFTHIDYMKNQYDIIDYQEKYSDANDEIPIDFYAEKKLHYKIWCIENGEYSRKTWYDLVITSLPKQYQELFNEMLI